MKNRIEGAYDEKDWFGVVKVDGKPLDPKRSQKVVNHSPDGFAWGYAGSGPAQLALAILLEVGVPEKQAVNLYQKFKFQFIANIPRDTFALVVDVREWAGIHVPPEAEGAARS